MSDRSNIIEYKNCQPTKKYTIICVLVFILLISIISISTLIGCGISSECPNGLVPAMIIISIFATVSFIYFTVLTLSIWYYNHNAIYKNTIDKNYLKKEISWQLDNKSKDQLEQIKNYISTKTSA
jgi:hypothetical protein